MNTHYKVCAILGTTSPYTESDFEKLAVNEQARAFMRLREFYGRESSEIILGLNPISRGRHDFGPLDRFMSSRAFVVYCEDPNIELDEALISGLAQRSHIVAKSTETLGEGFIVASDIPDMNVGEKIELLKWKY